MWKIDYDRNIEPTVDWLKNIAGLVEYLNLTVVPNGLQISLQSSYGYNMWRDPYKPSQILKQLCHRYNLEEPNYVGNKIQLAGITFDDTTTLPSSRF